MVTLVGRRIYPWRVRAGAETRFSDHLLPDAAAGLICIVRWYVNQREFDISKAMPFVVQWLDTHVTFHMRDECMHCNRLLRRDHERW